MYGLLSEGIGPPITVSGSRKLQRISNFAYASTEQLEDARQLKDTATQSVVSRVPTGCVICCAEYQTPARMPAHMHVLE